MQHPQPRFPRLARLKRLKSFKPLGILPRQGALALCALACWALAALPGAARADNWPSKAVTIVSPYAAGGTNDIVARMVAERFSRIFGQPFIVENKPGAAGIVGSTWVMRAPPDGYTLLSANNGALMVQAVVKTPPPFDPSKNFTPLFKYADAAQFIGVANDLPVKTVAELIALARQKPGQLNYSTAGSGSFGNFIGEYFKLQTKTDIVHVPSKGSAAALTELMSGRIQVMFDPLVLSQASGGRIRVLATTNHERFEGQPDIPTIQESGGPEMGIVGWFGLLGPAQLPKDIVEKIETASRAVAADPEVRKVFLAAGLTVAPLASAPFAALIKSDLAGYAEIKTRANMAVE